MLLENAIQFTFSSIITPLSESLIFKMFALSLHSKTSKLSFEIIQHYSRSWLIGRIYKRSKAILIDYYILENGFDG